MRSALCALGLLFTACAIDDTVPRIDAEEVAPIPGDTGAPTPVHTDPPPVDTAVEDSAPGDSAHAPDTAPIDADGDGSFVGTDCDDQDPGVRGPRPRFRDADGDGLFGTPIVACPNDPATSDRPDDCDDNDPAPEASVVQLLPVDDDLDGFGGRIGPICAQYPGWADNTDDCDDADPAVGAPVPRFEDLDGDGLGGAPALACPADATFTDQGGDCDDLDASQGGPNSAYADADGDGFGGAPILACPADASAPVPGDCDDANAAVFPGAVEACNAADDDCDGAVDESGGAPHWPDADGDGFAAQMGPVSTSCTVPAGRSRVTGDCDDARAAVFPGATEVCNGIDDNCDGLIDEGVQTRWWRDADGDGFGGATSQLACVIPAGFVAAPGDCADADAARFPGAPETCDGTDQDCDSAIDEGVQSLFWPDADGDGWGAGAPVMACAPPAGTAAQPGDCDDAAADAHPAATERCNGRDDDCDGQIDEGVKTAFYADADLDGHGATGAAAVLACAPPAAHAAVDDDCDDTDPTVHPNAREVCDGQDNRCTGSPTFHEGGNSCGSATLGLQRNGTLYLASTSRLDRAAASSFCANRGYTLWVPGDFGEWISVQAAFQVPSTGQATLQLGLDVPYHVGAQTQCGSSGSGLRDHDDRTGACSAGAPAWLSAQGIDTSGLSPSYAGPRYVQKASAPLATFAYATGLATAYAVCSN